MNKKWLWAAVVPLLLALLNGGSDAVDINRIIYVVGLGIDGGADGYSYTFYTAEPTGSDTAVGDNNVIYRTASLGGESLAAAVRALEQGSSRDISFEHLNCTALGQSVMDGDIGGMLDFLLRDSSVRRQCTVLALEGSAEDFFSAEYSGSIASAASSALEQLDDSDSRSSIMNLGRLGGLLERREGFCLYVLGLSQAGVQTSPTDASGAAVIELRGLAVYNSEGLGGVLDRDQAELARLFTHGQVSGLLTCVSGSGGSCYYEITYSACRRSFTPAEPCSAQIEIDAECILVDAAGADVPPDDRTLSDELKRQLGGIIELSRKYGAALTGLETEARQSNRLWYDSVKSDWDDLYRNAQISLTVHCTTEKRSLS